MEIIMLQDVEKVGDKHTVIKVKDGFGRNYLIPKGMGIIANKTNRARLDEMLKHEASKEAKLVGTYKELAQKLDGKTLRIIAKAASTGKIFGSVSNVQIAQALKDQLGIEVERKKIHILEEVIRLAFDHFKCDRARHIDMEVDLGSIRT